MKLESLLAAITPLPHEIRSGDPHKENLVADVRGVAIYGPYKAARAIDDARYLNHAANVLPELFSAANEYLAEHLRNGMVKAKTIARLQAALMAAEEVNDA